MSLSNLPPGVADWMIPGNEPPKKQRVGVRIKSNHYCKGCGCLISKEVEYCGECICEEDQP